MKKVLQVDPTNSDRLVNFTLEGEHKRRLQTVQAVQDPNCRPKDANNIRKNCVKDALWHTTVHICSPKRLVRYISTSNKFQKCVIPKLVKHYGTAPVHVHMAKSVVLLYHGSLMSKTKYQSLRNISRKDSPQESYLPYKSLMAQLNAQHLSALNVERLTDIQGYKRNMDLLLKKLASMYLAQDAALPDDHILDWFGKLKGTFLALLTIGRRAYFTAHFLQSGHSLHQVIAVI